MRGSVGSFGSPLPKSITGTPSASSRRRSSSRRTNGYVAISASVGEMRTARRYRSTVKTPGIILVVSHRQPDPAPGAQPERGFAVAVLAPGVDEKEELDELGELASTAGVETVGELVQHRPRPDPRTYVGKGKLEELKEAYGTGDAEVLVVDDELDPVQQRALENALQARVVDRTQLILDIFAQHAVSAEGKLQVELAQLEYNLPRTRGFEHDGRRYLVTDTVGFIRRLPHQLVEGFAATLEETLVADVVLHVVDGSVPEPRLELMVQAVDAVLREIGASELPIELVVNKVDAVDPLARRRLANRFPGALQVSALTGEGLDELRARLAARFGDRFEPVRLLLPHSEGGKLAELYALGAPIDEREDGEEGVYVRARLPRRELRRFAPYLVAEAHAERARSRG